MDKLFGAKRTNVPVSHMSMGSKSGAREVFLPYFRCAWYKTRWESPSHAWYAACRVVHLARKGPGYFANG